VLVTPGTLVYLIRIVSIPAAEATDATGEERTTVRISISLPLPGGSPDGTIAACDRLTRVSEQCGFHAIAASDHPFPYLGEGSPSHQSHDPFALLSFLAAKTTRIRLQFSLLVAPYRNPFLAARMLATLDQVSTGRVMATFGAGYNRQEFAALGARFGDRGQQVVDVVTAMEAAWGGDPVFAQGPGWQAAGNVLAPGCVQHPRPPLWRGGNSAAARRQAAAKFDGWAPLEAGDRHAQRVDTTGLTLRSIEDAAAGFSELWDENGRPGRPDVCFVRTRTDWLSDEDRILSEVGALAEAGVTWIEFRPAGDSPGSCEESLRATGDTLRRAGLLDQPQLDTLSSEHTGVPSPLTLP
jgi:probable F420-dependent oxidoreductase